MDLRTTYCCPRRRFSTKLSRGLCEIRGPGDYVISVLRENYNDDDDDDDDDGGEIVRDSINIYN